MRDLIMKCKVVYNFQCIEFEMPVDLDNEETINEVFDIYDILLEGLMAVAPEQEKVQATPQKKKPKEEMATPGQINYLEGLGFPREEATKLTKAQASMKIKEMS